MKKTIALIFCLFLSTSAVLAGDNPKVLMETSMGDVTLELNTQAAPETVKNFLGYINDGSYDGTIFHRVMKAFMNQGGGFTADFKKKPTKPPITNEADNGLKNDKGTIAMARTNQPHSATNQFFINTADNDFLNHTRKTMRGWGYTVFGKVTQGMDVMRKIEQSQTHTNDIGMQNVPVKAIVIKKMSVINNNTATGKTDKK